MEQGLGAAAPDFGMLVLKGGGALILVLGLLLLTLYLMRRMGGGRGVSGRMRMLDVLQVGTKERVVLVAVRDRELLLGVTSASIRTLAEFPGEEKEIPAPEPGFGAFLRGALGKKEKAGEAPEAGHGR